MDNQSARDPYLALNEHFKRQAQQVILPGHTLGQVLCVAPLRVRADGLDLDAEDLRVAWHLTDDWMDRLMATVEFLTAAPPPALQAGDTVLLLPSEDRQIYYILDKFTEVAR